MSSRSGSGSGSAASTPQFTNRLAASKSPYLLHHAHNPVDWYPWSEEAFQLAKASNKPIFLSNGYDSCHWCHVMATESFQDVETAEFLNENFVSIKVDREELPAVDKLYMSFVQATTGSGGWPLSVWLTPDLKPWYGGTYYPKVGGPGNPSFMTVLKHLSGLWNTQREKIIASADQVKELLKQQNASERRDAVAVSDASLAGMSEKLYGWLEQGFDEKWGGFGRAPKFPTPPQLVFLAELVGRGQKFASLLAPSSDEKARDEAIKSLATRLSMSEGDLEDDLGKRVEMAEQGLEMLQFTLQRIAEGGIHDHLGFGFHRYSVDGEWHGER